MITGTSSHGGLLLTRCLLDSGKKGGSTIYGRKGKQLKRHIGVLLGHAERKLERKEPS